MLNQAENLKFNQILESQIRIWWLKEINTSGNQLDFEFLKTVRNSQWPMEFWECDIANKVIKKFIFENTYLYVTFGQSCFVCLCSFIYSFFLKVPKKDKSLLYSCFSLL